MSINSANTAAAATTPAVPAVHAVSAVKSSKSSNGNNSSNLIADLKNLNDQRDHWEKGVYKTSNEHLYVILGRCLDIYTQMKGDLPQRMLFNNELKNANIKFTNATNLAPKIVRFVFRNDRTRSFSYARTIMTAADANIDGMKLPKWVYANGGVEEIRRAAKNGISPSQLNHQHAEIASAQLTKKKALVDAFKAPAELQPHGEAAHTFTVALVRKNADGTSSIVYGSNNEALISKMLAFAGKHIVANKTQEDELKHNRALKKTREEIISAAA